MSNLFLYVPRGHPHIGEVFISGVYFFTFLLPFFLLCLPGVFCGIRVAAVGELQLSPEPSPSAITTSGNSPAP